MKKNTEMNIKEAKRIVESIGSMYRQHRRNMDIVEFQDCVQENYAAYKGHANFVFMVDRLLKDCSRDTRIIIRNDFLQIPEKDWFLEYYSKSTYYRLRRLAIEEFVDCLNN